MIDLRAAEDFCASAIDLGKEALHDRAPSALAEEWRAAGISPGDLVILSLPTGVALLQHFFGVIAAGGVPALVAPGTPSVRLRELASVMHARAIAAVRLPAGLGDGALSRLGALEVALRDAGEPLTREGEVVLLTSGTSGAASGCVFGVDALLQNGARHAASLGIRAGDVVLVSLPLHFSFALVAQALGTLSVGGRLVIAGPPFNPEAYLAALASQHVTASALTPVLVRSLILHLDHHAAAIPSSLRVLSVGGDSLGPSHVKDLLRVRPGGELYLTYGLTQAGPRVSTLAAHREPEERYASVGLPLEGTRTWLEDLPDGSGRRQLMVSSSTVMRRRIGLVEGRSSDDLRAPKDGLPVLATGDVFETDSAGYLYYKSRLSEYILRGGEKVSLATVRRVATSLPDVVGAKVKLSPRDDGQDFDLLLVVNEAGLARGTEHYRAQIGRSLRRAEHPRAIEIALANEARAFEYK